ncbi:hypothetical protein V1524DRAFT_145987 [Lipomyces starkeyi]
MKFGIVATTMALLVAQTRASVWYWCTDRDVCNWDYNGVGPTYVCGVEWFGYYDSNVKMWIEDGDHLSDAFWVSGGFYDCCHNDGKGACYNIL